MKRLSLTYSSLVGFGRHSKARSRSLWFGSRLTAPPPVEIQEMVEDLRMPAGELAPLRRLVGSNM